MFNVILVFKSILQKGEVLFENTYLAFEAGKAQYVVEDQYFVQ